MNEFFKYISRGLLLLNFFTISALGLSAQSLEDGIKATERSESQKAKSIFQQLIAAQPQEASLYYHMGNAYFGEENYDSAQFYYTKAYNINGKDPLALTGMGKWSLYDKKYADAKKYFVEAAAAGPKNHYVMQQIADAYAQTQTTEDATYALGLIQKANELTKNENPYYRVTLADVLRLTGESGKGASEYEKILQSNPNFPQAALRLGQLYTKVKNYPEGLKFFEKAMAIDPTYPPVYRDLGEYYFYTGQVDKAIQNYEKFLNLVGNSASERLRYASFLFVQKSYAKALEELKKINSEGNFLFLRLMGYTNYETGNYPEGIAYMDKYFKKVKPENIISKDYEYYGLLQSKTGNDSLAVVNYEKGLKMDASNTSLYDAIAESYGKQKKYELAAQAIQQKLTASTGGINAQDYFTLGRFYYVAEKFPEADSAFVKVNQYFPDYAVGYLYRARINANMDPDSKLAMAKPFYEQFIEKASAEKEKYKKELVEAYGYLGNLAWKNKDNEKTKEYFTKLQELDPQNEGAKQMLEYLKQSKQ